MKNILSPVVLALCIVYPWVVYSGEIESHPSYTTLFDEICGCVESNFYNPDFIKKEFSQIRAGSSMAQAGVYLVNKTARSGKEILAFGAKKYRLATVIGERTAGAVLGGSLFPLSNGDFLYLAGRSGLVDNVELEGVGVAPDIEVPMDIRYREGCDPQIERAVQHLLESVRS